MASNIDEREAVRRLVSDGTLTAEQGEAVVAALAGAGAAPSRGWLVEAAGYVGGALLLAGGTLLVGASWDELGRPGRFVVLLAATVALVGAALIAGGGLAALRAAEDSARRRIASVLLALASGTAALAVGVAVADHGGLAGGAVGLGLAVLAYALVPSLPVLVAATVLSALTAAAFVDDVLGFAPLRIGLALIVVGAVWAGLGLGGVVRHREGALVLGAGIALIGAQLPNGEATAAWAYALTLLVALGCFAAYTVERSVPLLVMGVIGVTLAAVEAVADWTEGAVGGASLVMIAGAVLLVASGVALRRRRSG